MLAGHGIDALHGRQDAALLAVFAYGEVLFFHAVGGLQDEACNLEIGEAGAFHLAEFLVGDFLQTVELLQFVLEVNDMLQALQEPDIYLGQFFNALHGIAFLQGLSDGEDAEVGRILQGIVEVVELRVVVAYESVHTLSDHAETLLDHLLETAADAHDLTHGLH